MYDDSHEEQEKPLVLTQGVENALRSSPAYQVSDGSESVVAPYATQFAVFHDRASHDALPLELQVTASPATAQQPLVSAPSCPFIARTLDRL